MKKAILFILIMLFIGSVVLSYGEPFITSQRRKAPAYSYDPLAVKALDPVFAFYPDASLVDYSFLLSPPAGKFGFIKTGDDGHFYFSDTNERARFWGVVITQEHIDIDKKQIPEIVETLARAGVNMVRFHAMDNRGGEEYNLVRRTIIEEGFPYNNDSQHYNPDYFDRLDYWIAECKKQGIYVYLVLRGYRTFRAGDEVENADKLDRAARPYAMFNSRLIELQKQYARDFMVEHVNPYTGLNYASDPAVAAIEIFNEDSLFMRPDKWQNMVEPYLSEFQRMWNEWLFEKYASTEALRTGWTNSTGECALAAGESLEQKSVKLPKMNLESYNEAIKAPYTDLLRSPVRRHDAAAFAIELQNAYLDEMKTYLKSIGVKVPVTGVVDSTVVADTYTVGKMLDFTAENAYYEHPIFLPGEEWKSKAFYKNINYVEDWGPWSLIPFIARYRWANVPVGVREWATCWPNEYRASSILEMAAYGRHQDLDLLTYFAYYTTGDFLRIGAFNLTCDPARWLLFGEGAKLFLSSSVRTAQHSVEIAYSREDLLAWASFIQRHHCLSWISKVSNCYFDTATTQKPQHSLLVTSGRTHNIDLAGCEKSLIYSNCPYVDFRQHKIAGNDNDIVHRSGYDIRRIDGGDLTFSFEGLGLTSALEKKFTVRQCFSADDLKSKGYQPFGVAGDKALGFYDSNRKNLLFAELPDEETPRMATQLLHFWYNIPDTYASFDIGESDRLITDTGEIIHDSTRKIEFIDTAAIQIIQGELKPGKVYETSRLTIQTANDYGVFVAMSLDGKPLSESEYFVVKMVTRAWNRGQRLEKANYPGRDDLYILEDGGQALVQTRDKASDEPTIVSLNGSEILRCYMLGGWWEAVFNKQEDTTYLACSGRNIRFKINPPWIQPKPQYTYDITHYFYEVPPRTRSITGEEIVYPSFQKYIKIKMR